jgi:hypothetical protein
VTVTVTDELTPIAGAEVDVVAEWISNSGGHNHDDPPSGWMKFRDLQNPEDKVPDEITVTTDSNGEAKLRFFAPPWGGRVRLRASTTYDSVELTDVDSLIVKVPDLLPLATQPGASALELIGGTCDHHGPRNDTQYPESCLTPDNNHYGVLFTLATLIEIDLDWAVDAQKQTGLPQGAKSQTPLQVNDISLPFGGKFQEDGDWTYERAHQYHQLGRDVDLRTQRSSKPDQRFRVGIYVETDTDRGPERRRNKGFEKLLRRFPGVVASVHNDETIYEHYHLYFYSE